MATHRLWPPYFSENGENIDQTGVLLRGREAIAQAFGKFFAQHKGAKIEISIQSIHFPQADLAVEDSGPLPAALVVFQRQ